ncbi:MAG: helix-turn-helix domain-containing protein [Clostridia bacterium]|nr:helix-turn-helix domain-containing protein [Clostridia bacterium]
MICLITPEPYRAVPIKKLLCEGGIFAYNLGLYNFKSKRSFPAYIKDLNFEPNILVADARDDISFAETSCKIFKEAFPNIKCISIVDKSKHSHVKFKYIENSDFEIDIAPSDNVFRKMRNILSRCSFDLPNIYKHLDMSGGHLNVKLFGYTFRLTATEYRVLLFFCQNPETVFTSKTLLGFCFPEGYRMTVTNVRTHISNINKKSIDLGGRCLIKNIKGVGYILNTYM